MSLISRLLSLLIYPTSIPVGSTFCSIPTPVYCHQMSALSMDAEMKWLEKTGVEPESLDSGCCGMARSFGFEKEKYEVPVKCGEHMVSPKAREADSATLIVANGFGCRATYESPCPAPGAGDANGDFNLRKRRDSTPRAHGYRPGNQMSPLRYVAPPLRLQISRRWELRSGLRAGGRHEIQAAL